MDEDLLLFSGMVLVLGLIVGGAFFGGKWVERRDYTGAFIKQVEAAYMDGYNDAINGLQRNP